MFITSFKVIFRTENIFESYFYRSLSTQALVICDQEVGILIEISVAIRTLPHRRINGPVKTSLSFFATAPRVYKGR